MLQPLRLTLLCALLFAGRLLPAQFKNTTGPQTAAAFTYSSTQKKLKLQPAVCFNTKTNVLHAVFVECGKRQCTDKKDSSRVYYTQSANLGKTWLNLKCISTFNGNCLAGDSALSGPACCLDTGGAVCVTWMGPKGLLFQRSADNGTSWLAEERVISTIKHGAAYTVAGVKTNGLPAIACDTGRSAFKGRLYSCWSDEKHGATDKDVFIIYSEDHGLNWTEPILVTYRANHKAQFFPRLAVDTQSGEVYVAYYDQQNYYAAGQQADIYLARSSNGGLKFDYYKVNERPLALKSSVFSAGGFQLAIEGGQVKLSWARTEKKDTLIYSAVINDRAFAAYNQAEADRAQQWVMPRTLVFSEKMALPFRLSKAAKLTAVITKPLEPAFEKTVITEKLFTSGENQLLINAKALGLKKGNYTLFLYDGTGNTFVWITEE